MVFLKRMLMRSLGYKLQVDVLSPWEGRLRNNQTHKKDAEPEEGEI